MNRKFSLLIAFCWLAFLPVLHSQVFDQAKLFKLLPAIPSNLSTASEEEVSAFTSQCDSISRLISGYEEKYKRTKDDESNSDLIMEYYDIRDSILDVHSTMRNKYYDLITTFSDLEYELSGKNDLVRESIDNIKYDDSKKEELKALYEQIYANKVECSEKQISIYLQFLTEYKAKLNSISAKANRSEIIPLPDYLNKDVSYVLLNVKNYLNYLSDVYRFNVGPNIEEYNTY